MQEEIVFTLQDSLVTFNGHCYIKRDNLLHALPTKR